VEVVVFSSVSDALLENPLPYQATSASLRSAVQALADYRCAQLGASPPYGLIAADVLALAERHGLRRVAVDGLHLGVHLLLPAQVAPSFDPVGTVEPFGAFASSLELATRIRFPWKLDALLAASYALFSGRADPSDCQEWPAETLLAAQILSVVWYRHNHVPTLIGTDEERMIGLRTRLREKGGRLATQELIEGYLRLVAERGGVADTQGDRQVLLVGADRIDRALTPALGRVGREVITTDDLADAQTIAERRPPAAIVIDHEQFPTQVDKFSRVTKLGGAALLFVLTDSTDPSLVLNLLDVGVDDVFGPPHDFDLVAARINRAIRSRSRDRAAEASPSGQFSATFEVFSFLDLIQMLSQGLKTVRIDLSRPQSAPAVIFMQKGRLIHARLGEVEGERAVHEVIAWEDEGEFTVRQETRFPEATIDYPTESVLMEGLRLLDESKL
jgi:DNA-binding response OmpR family regulator